MNLSHLKVRSKNTYFTAFSGPKQTMLEITSFSLNAKMSIFGVLYCKTNVVTEMDYSVFSGPEPSKRVYFLGC